MRALPVLPTWPLLPPLPHPAAQSQDVLLDGFNIQAHLTHSVGAGSSGMFSVFTNGVMKDGNLELHR